MSSPGKKWSSRFGAAVRRSSSILSVSRPTTPSADADRSSLIGSDRESLRGDRDSATKVDAVSRLITPAVAVASHPSPIAESPAREAAATSDEPLGPSPLAKSGVAGASSSEVNLPLTTAIVPPAAPAGPEETVVSPSGYVPPPVIDSTAGNPGAFTDDPDSLPPTGPVQDPYAPSIRAASRAPSRAPSILENPHPVQEEPAPAPAAPAPEPEPEVTKVDDVPVVVVDEPQPMSIPTAPNTPPAPVVRSLTPEPAPVDTALEDAAAQERSRDFAETAHHNASLGSHATPAAAVAPAPPTAPPSIPDMDHGEAAEFYRGGPESKAPSKAPSIANIPVSKEKEKEVVIVPDWDPASTSSKRDPEHSYSLPAYSSSGQEVWGGKPLDQDPVVIVDDPFTGGVGMPVPETNGHSNGHAHDDPFADHNKFHAPEPIVGIREETNGGIVMPLPPRDEVIPSTSLHGMPDEGSYTFRAPTKASDPATDERLPLLSKPQTNYGGGPPSVNTHSNIYISPVDPSSSNGGPTQWRPVNSDPHPTSHLRLHELGWLEYHLPDGTVYYVHPTRRVTTECNLRSERILDQLCAFLDDKGLGDTGGRGKSQGSGVEVWCRDLSAAAAGTSGRKGKKIGFVGALYWVDHNARTIVPDAYGFSVGAIPPSRGKKGKAVTGSGPVELDDEDQLDCEYRYWSFVEAHPAHNPLQAKAKAEALDVLNWAWTDRLLPSSNAIPPPFAQEECQELMALLRSFSADQVQNENGIQNRIVARILIRVAQWRQAYFRPNKSLPTDVPLASSAATGGPYSPYAAPQRRTASRAVVDFLISCVCLGIPYIFLERTGRLGGGRVDEEGGLRAAASSPFIVVGACTCLVAAIVLSASVTFLSLPGLDDASRVAGIVAIALATLSLVTTVVAVFKYKSDMGRTVGHVGAHGLVMITRRSVVLALPTVFLVYAIIGFVTGIVIYSVRGHAALGSVEGAQIRVQEGVSVAETVFGRTKASTSSFSAEGYARWPFVGVVGVVGGMLATSALLVRR